MNLLLNSKSLLSEIYTIKVLNVSLVVEGDRGQTINENKIMITKVGMYGGTTVQYVTKNDLFQDCLRYIKKKGYQVVLIDGGSTSQVLTNFTFDLHKYEHNIQSKKDLFSCLLVLCKIIAEDRNEHCVDADNYNIGDN